MKKNDEFLIFLFSLSVFFSRFTLASSLEKEKGKNSTVLSSIAEGSAIAIVDVEKIVNGLESFNEFKKNIDEEKALAESQLESKVIKLREEDEDLKSKVSILSEEALRDKMLKLQERYVKLQEEARDRMANLQKKLDRAMEIIDKELRSTVAELIRETKYSGYSTVVGRQAILYYSENNDITLEVLGRLNRKKLNLAGKISTAGKK
jgi:Skp family chaperone for outer membrane proteins